MHRLPTISIAALFLSPAAALATWNPSGSPVCVAPGFQGDLIAVPVPEAYATSSWQSMFTLWSDARDTVPASADLYFDLIGPFGPADPPTNGSPAVAASGFQGYADACFTESSAFERRRNHGVGR